MLNLNAQQPNLSLNQHSSLKTAVCVCISLCTTVLHKTAENSSYNILSYPPDNDHISNDVYWRGGTYLHSWFVGYNWYLYYVTFTLIYITTTGTYSQKWTTSSKKTLCIHSIYLHPDNCNTQLKVQNTSKML